MVLPWVTAVPEVFFSISSAGETASKNTTLTSDETKDQLVQDLVLLDQGQN